MLTRRRLLQTAFGAAASAATPAFAQQPAKKRIIVDSQIHMWKANTPDRPWAPNTRPQTPEPNTIERVFPMIDAAGVDRVVIVPPTLEGKRVDYGQEAARRYPGRFATMGSVVLNDPKEAERVKVWRDQLNVLGVRLNIAGESANWMKNGEVDWLWPVAEQHNVPIMFLTTGQLPLFHKVAERHPGLPLILDHMGISSEAMRGGIMKETVEEAAGLAKYPNMSVKLSSAVLFSKEAYPWRDVTPYIHRLYDAYGPRRCHWGTDVTNSWDKADYKSRVTHFTETLDFFSEEDKDWIMGKSILEKLRWS